MSRSRKVLWSTGIKRLSNRPVKPKHSFYMMTQMVHMKYYTCRLSGPDPEHSNTGGGCGGIDRAGPRTLECGGAPGSDPEQSNTGTDVSGVSRNGGEYERGSPPLI